MHYFLVTKSDYEHLLDRIKYNLGGTDKESQTSFELPVVDVMWEGQKTFLRNFSEFPKILRRDPDKVLQYLSNLFPSPFCDKPCSLFKTLHPAPSPLRSDIVLCF